MTCCLTSTRPYPSLILTSLAALAEEEEGEERAEVAANGHYGGYCDGIAMGAIDPALHPAASAAEAAARVAAAASAHKFVALMKVRLSCHSHIVSALISRVNCHHVTFTRLLPPFI